MTAGETAPPSGMNAMNELASTYTAEMIKALLSVHALTNMHRATGNEEHRKTAAAWIPTLESQFTALRRELTLTQQ